MIVWRLRAQLSTVGFSVSVFVPQHPPLPPTQPSVYVLTALWGEAAAHTDPEGELRDQPELASYTEKENPLIIVDVHASERIPQSHESNLVRQGAV